jgi:hypothetical protein
MERMTDMRNLLLRVDCCMKYMMHRAAKRSHRIMISR